MRRGPPLALAALCPAWVAAAQTSTSTFTVTLPTGTLTTTVTLPTGTTTATYTLPTGTATTTATFTIPTGTQTTTGTVTLPTGTHTQTTTFTLPTATSTVTRTVTLPTGTATLGATVTLPSSTLTATDTVTLPYGSATGSATFTLPGETATTTDTVTLPSGTVTATATFTLPTASQSVTQTVTLPSGSVSGTASFTLPTGTATLTETVTLPSAAATTTQAVTLPTATVTSTETFTLPTGAHTETVTMTLPSSTETATETWTLPSVTTSLTGTLTLPTGSDTLTLTATLPSESATAAVTLTLPARTVTSVDTVTLPTRTATVTESFTLPSGTVTGGVTVTLPSSTVTAVFTATLPTLTATVGTTVTIPSASATVTQTFTVPTGTATATDTVTLPTGAATVTETFTLPSGARTATVTVSLPTVTEERQATFTLPTQTLTQTTTATLPTSTKAISVTLPGITETYTLPTGGTTMTETYTLPTTADTITTSLTGTRTVVYTATLPTITDAVTTTATLPDATATATLPTDTYTFQETFTIPTETETATGTITVTETDEVTLPTATTTVTLGTATTTVTASATETIQLGFGQLATPEKMGPVYINPARRELLALSFTLPVIHPERRFSSVTITPQAAMAEFVPESVTLTCNGVPPGCDEPLAKELNFTLYGVALGNDLIEWVVSQPSNATDGSVGAWVQSRSTMLEIIDLIQFIFLIQQPDETPRYPGEATRTFVMTLTQPPLQSTAVSFVSDDTTFVRVDCAVSQCDESTGVNRTILTPSNYRVSFDVTGWIPGSHMLEVVPAGGLDSLFYYGRHPTWNHTVLERVKLELAYEGLHLYETLSGGVPNVAAPVVIRPSQEKPHRDQSFHLVLYCWSEPAGLTFQGDPDYGGYIPVNNGSGIKTSFQAGPPGAFDIYCKPTSGTLADGTYYGSSFRHFEAPPPIINFFVFKKSPIVPPSIPTLHMVTPPDSDPESNRGGAYSPRLKLQLPYAPKFRLFVAPISKDVQFIPANISYYGSCPSAHENRDFCDFGDSQRQFQLRGLRQGTHEITWEVWGEDRNDYIHPDPVAVTVEGPNAACDALTTAQECYGSWDAGCHFAVSACSSDLGTFNLPTYREQFIGETVTYQVSPRVAPLQHVTLKLSGYGLTFSPQTLEWGTPSDPIPRVSPNAASIRAQITVAASIGGIPGTSSPSTAADYAGAAPDDSAPEEVQITPAPQFEVPNTAQAQYFTVYGMTDNGETADLRVTYSVGGDEHYHYETPTFQTVHVMALLQIMVPGTYEYPFFYVGTTSDTFSVLLEEAPRVKMILIPEILRQDNQAIVDKSAGAAIDFDPPELEFIAGVRSATFRVTLNRVGRHKVGFRRTGHDASIYAEPPASYIQVFATVPIYAPPLPSLGAEEWSPPQWISLETAAVHGLKIRVIAAAPDTHVAYDHTNFVQVARYCGTITDCRPEVPVNNVTLEFGTQTRALAYIFRGMQPGWFGIKYEVTGQDVENFVHPDPADFTVQQPRVWDAAATLGGGQTGVDPRCKVSAGRLDFNSLGLSDATQESCSIGAPVDYLFACDRSSKKECERQRQEKGIACVWHGPVVGGECRYGLPDGNVTHWAVGEFHWLYRMQDGRLYSAGSNSYGQLGHSCSGISGCNDTLEFREVEFESRDSRNRCTRFVQKRLEGVQTSATDLIDTDVCSLREGGALGLVTDNGVKDPVVHVAVGSYHSMVQTLSGAVYTWGSNFHGQLGVTTQPVPSEVRRPYRVQLPSRDGNITCIAAGAYHSIGLSYDGNVWVWGSNYYGQLGTGPTYRGKQFNPVDIAREGVQRLEWRLDPPESLSAGHYHSMVGTKSGEIYTWGRNNYGQLGRIGFDDLVPTPIETREPRDMWRGTKQCKPEDRIPKEWPESVDWTLGVVYKTIYEL